MKGSDAVKDIPIRPAELSDLDIIVELNHSLFQEDAGQRDPFTNLGWAHQEGREHFTHRITADDNLCVVAEMDGRIVGYLAGRIGGPSGIRSIRSADLESIFVVDDVRGRGVGRALAGVFLRWCGEQEAQRVSVTAYASNDGAIRFYRRLGFEPKEVALERSV